MTNEKKELLRISVKSLRSTLGSMSPKEADQIVAGVAYILELMANSELPIT